MKINSGHAGRIALLSGIPRSGTTLACNLLNRCNNTVALHEPLDPNNFKQERDRNALSRNVLSAILELRSDVATSKRVTSGARQGLSVDNPVSEEYEGELRRVRVARGEVDIKKSLDNDFLLVVKQNAFFAALAEQLGAQTQLISIVRNPVEVLLSWWTVDLPINDGYIPAAERIDENLVSRLLGKGRIARQLEIYRWFCEQYIQYSHQVLRYEDIISSNGESLCNAFRCKGFSTDALSFKFRKYPDSAIDMLLRYQNDIVQLSSCGFYSESDITTSIETILKSDIA